MLTRPSQIKITLLWHEVAKSEISGFHLGFQQPQKIKTKRKKDQKGCALSRRQDSKEQLCLRLPPIFHDGFDETAKHWFPHVFLRVILVSWMCWIFGRKTITKTYTSYIQSGSRRNQQSRPQNTSDRSSKPTSARYQQKQIPQFGPSPNGNFKVPRQSLHCTNDRLRLKT